MFCATSRIRRKRDALGYPFAKRHQCAPNAAIAIQEIKNDMRPDILHSHYPKLVLVDTAVALCAAINSMPGFQFCLHLHSNLPVPTRASTRLEWALKFWNYDEAIPAAKLPFPQHPYVEESILDFVPPNVVEESIDILLSLADLQCAVLLLERFFDEAICLIEFFYYNNNRAV